MGYPPGHPNPGVAAVTAVLEEWCLALEDGSHVYRMPAPDYQRPGGKDLWTEDELDLLMRALDAEIDQEVTRAPGTSVGAKAGPAFHRLAVPQRLALAQQLADTVAEHVAVLDAAGIKAPPEVAGS
jgi:hypothetical protein